jgi:hypothetical protein
MEREAEAVGWWEKQDLRGKAAGGNWETGNESGRYIDLKPKWLNPTVGIN